MAMTFCTNHSTTLRGECVLQPHIANASGPV
jgi:hypothetical protein